MPRSYDVAAERAGLTGGGRVPDAARVLVDVAADKDRQHPLRGPALALVAEHDRVELILGETARERGDALGAVAHETECADLRKEAAAPGVLGVQPVGLAPAEGVRLA